MDSSLKNDIKVITGNFNTKIGKGKVFRLTTAIYRFYSETDNDVLMLLQLAAPKDLVVGSILFPGKSILKGTWRSTDVNSVN